MPVTTFEWVPSAARFRDQSGKWVSRASVTAGLNRVIQRAENRVRTAANAYRRKKLSLDDFMTIMRAEAKTTHIAAYATGKGGFKQMTQSDYGKIGATLKKQYVYLDRFTADLASNEVALDGRFLNRAVLYVRDARRSYYMADRQVHIDAGFTEEHNHLAKADNCVGCLEATASGWVGIGMLVPVGERDCLGNCLCAITYRK